MARRIVTDSGYRIPSRYHGLIRRRNYLPYYNIPPSGARTWSSSVTTNPLRRRRILALSRPRLNRWMDAVSTSRGNNAARTIQRFVRDPGLSRSRSRFRRYNTIRNMIGQG